MLYIFQVDSGDMLTLDMNLALESVSNLKQVISQHCKIPLEKQVLLISGGYSLDPGARVCNYSAGTDTSPIFLFDKTAIENPSPPAALQEAGNDYDMKEKVEGSLNMPATYNTIVCRAQLAQQFFEVSKDQRRSCEHLVHDQHLMQQGWAAVVANLEDISSIFKVRSDSFERNFNTYLESRPYNVSLLKNFSQDLALLSRIPVLPILLKATEAEGAETNAATINLLHWINSKDNQNSLEQIAEICTKCIEKFDSTVLNGLLVDVCKALKDADNPDMKEIKGLEERLYGLEQLMFEAKKTVDDQGGLAQAFHQHQNRVSNLKDPSIYGDLCASHKQQLNLVLKNHDLLRDIKRRCLRAKSELCYNLHARLRWIMFVEGQLSDIDNKLTIYNENLKRIKSHLEVVRQIHLAPRVYLAAVSEVVRRRHFSKVFLQWANQLSSHSQIVHSRELEIRKTFNGQLTNHFLQTLFPGMYDTPPPFATQAPLAFDDNLPPVEGSDVELLRSILPDLMGTDQGVNSHLPTLEYFCYAEKEDSLDGFPLVQSSSAKIRSTTNLNQSGNISKIRESFAPLSRDLFLPISEEEDFVEVPEMDLGNTPPQEIHTSEVEALRAPLGCTPSCPPSAHSPNLLSEEEGVLVSPSSPPDFATADFYIDESMPSSYTESNGNTPAHPPKGAAVIVSSSGPGSGLPLPKSFAELQHELEEKETLLMALQENLKSKSSDLEERNSGLVWLEESLQRVLNGGKSLETLEEGHEVESRILKSFQELERQLKEEKELKEKSEKELQEKILHDLGMLDKIFQENPALGQQSKEHPDIIDQETKAVDFVKIFSLHSNVQQSLRSLEEKEVDTSDLEMIRREEERTLEESRKVEELENRLSQSKDEITSLQQLLKERDEAYQVNKCMELEAYAQNLKTQHLKEIQDARRNGVRAARLLPTRSSYEEVERLWDTLTEISDARNLSYSEREEKLEKSWRSTIESLLVQGGREGAPITQQLGFLLVNQHLETGRIWRERIVQERKAWKEYGGVWTKECGKMVSRLRGLCFKDWEFGDNSSVSYEAFEACLHEILSSLRTWQSHSPLEPPLPVIEIQTLQNLKEQIQDVLRMENPSSPSSMTDSSREPISPLNAFPLLDNSKVSVLKCNVGDLVLLTYDEKHENYVVFILDSTLHFVNTDSLEFLGLSRNTQGNEPRRAWALGLVTEKEYCKAKKVPNRYRVPLDSRFYRVSVKPWLPETSSKTTMTASVSSVKVSTKETSRTTEGHSLT